jgi:N4-(beta-N-acetylglucosaminyl)-L-asparaginase
MKLKRRSFFSNATLAALAASMGVVACRNEAAPKTKTHKSNPNSTSGKPMTIATWPNELATAAAWKVLAGGGSALDAVEQGAQIPEADPSNTSVGLGGLPDRDGTVTLDACIMDAAGNAGSVTFVQNILHPISLARKVMEKTPHLMLSGAGAEQFAAAEGFPKVNLLTEGSKKAWEEWKVKTGYQPMPNHDTIGILALDQKGLLSGGCTTSGAAYKMHGRVGDSPIIGAGLFVDNEIGAATATGLGELMMKTLSSFLIVELMRQGLSPQEACEEAIHRIATKYPDKVKPADVQSGVIAINPAGEHGAYSLRPGFSYTIFMNGENKVFVADHYMD